MEKDSVRGYKGEETSLLPLNLFYFALKNVREVIVTVSGAFYAMIGLDVELDIAGKDLLSFLMYQDT